MCVTIECAFWIGNWEHKIVILIESSAFVELNEHEMRNLCAFLDRNGINWDKGEREIDNLLIETVLN